MRRTGKTTLFLSIFIITLTVAFTLASKPLILQTSAVNGISGYVGAEECAICHAGQHSSWNQTAHANMAGIYAINASGTFYWVHAPNYTVMDQAAFIQRCARCHVTGWDPSTQTWPYWNSTDPDLAESFLNVQCEVCHGPGTDMPWGTASMILNYSSTLCGQCHGQAADLQISAHSNSLADMLARPYAQDSCLRCMSTQGFLEKPVFLNTTGLESVSCAACHDPHSEEYEYQLRFENSTELCGQCHTGSHHPQYEVFKEGPHEMAGLECANCHGQGTRLFHGTEEPWYNHTFWIYNTFYPYNQTEPIVCSSCHEQSWATQMLRNIQTTLNATMKTVEEAIARAESAITTANQSGADPTLIEEAENLLSQAKDNLSFVEHEGSLGFHNPMYSVSLLNDAMNYANEAYALVTTPIPEFPSALVLSLLVIVTMVAIIAYKKYNRSD